MTVKELFEKDIDTIANAVADERYRPEGMRPTSFALPLSTDCFDDSIDCPEKCEFLEQGWRHEDAWMNGGCNAPFYKEPCPYNIRRKETYKRLLKEWLEQDIEG